MNRCIALEGGSGNFNSQGTIGLCCNDAAHKNREDNYILNFKQRQEYLKSKSFTWDDFQFCNFCKQNEEKGYRSTRQIINERESIFELTVNVGNICNLRCAMCHPNFSYLISQDVEALSEDLRKKYSFYPTEKNSITPEIKDNIEKFISTIDRPIYLNILGGEPLINLEMIDWFNNMLSKFSHIIELQITTNLTYNTKRTMTLLENEKVRVSASIEGVEDSYEWGRFGSKWNNVLSNLLTFRSHIGYRLHVHSVIHAISILGEKSLANLLNEHRIDRTISLLSNPQLLQLKVLNQKERDALNLENIDAFDENLRNQFNRYMLNLEKTRKQPMPKSIADFYNLY